MNYDYVVVGAGFAGSTLAERLASQCRARVLVVDARSHVGGNAYDPLDEHGVRVHRYGPHIFHTSSPRIVEYLSQFTGWHPYEHRVLASVDGREVPLPICAGTIAALYGLHLGPAEMADFFEARRERLASVRNSEDAIVSRVGRELYERLFAGYTRKQWGLDARELDASVCGRVPVRTDADDRYFSDTFQAVPRAGYEAMFLRMLDHPNIEVALGERFEDLPKTLHFDHMVFTGPIDAYFKNDPDAALAASRKLGANYILRGNITTSTTVNPTVHINEVAVRLDFSLTTTGGQTLSDVSAHSESYAGADTLGMAQTLVKEQADQLVAQLYNDYCRKAGNVN